MNRSTTRNAARAAATGADATTAHATTAHATTVHATGAVASSADARPGREGAAATATAGAPCCAPLLAAALSEAEAEDLAAVLKALADPVRLRLVSLIATAPGGELCACDLPALLDRSQPTVSHHLTQLARAGIVDREQRGKWAWFRLRPERLEALGRALTAPTTA